MQPILFTVPAPVGSDCRRARHALDRHDGGQAPHDGRLFVGRRSCAGRSSSPTCGGHAQPEVDPVLSWIQSGTLNVDRALRVEALTAVMLVVVTTVSSLVHLYSWGYMDGGPTASRASSPICRCSAFAMLMLVTADNLVQMFFGWEGVGLASYLLIGFWYHKPSANAAALKAFVVNRIGDFGFCSASSAPSSCSAPSRSRRSSPRRRAWPDRRSASPASASTR